MRRIFFSAFCLSFLTAACANQVSTPTAAASIAPDSNSSPIQASSPTPDFTATAEAMASEQMSYLLEEVAPVLENVGYSIDEGHLVYVQSDPIEVVAERAISGETDFFENPFLQELEAADDPLFENFILKVDVEVDSEVDEGGSAGCYILFRVDGDFFEAPTAMFSIYRPRDGGLAQWNFVLYSNYGFIGTLNPGEDGRYPIRTTIDLEAGVNSFVLIADGLTATAFANGDRMGPGTLLQGQTQGKIAFGTSGLLRDPENSAETTCTFSNAWIWELP